MWVGVAVLGTGALVALLLPFRTPRAAEAAALAWRSRSHGRGVAPCLPGRWRERGWVAGKACPEASRKGDAARVRTRGGAGAVGCRVAKGCPRARDGSLYCPSRRRVPAAERREALIAAAVHEFALSGLHGTPVDRIARRVGVAQPYVFSLFAGKRDLFLAAVDHCFDRFAETFAGPPPNIAPGGRPRIARTC